MASAFDSSAMLFRIYVERNQMKEGQPAAEWIVCRACERGLAGASVIQCIGGFFSNAPITNPILFQSSFSHPVIVEIIDQDEKLESFAAYLKSEVASLLMVKIPVAVAFS